MGEKMYATVQSWVLTKKRERLGEDATATLGSFFRRRECNE